MSAPAAPAWTRSPLLKRVGSLKFAVVMISGFAAVMVLGLWYEGEYGTPAAQAHIYKAWWFNLMFLALAANIAGAALTRYPWPRRLTGFVITHLGLLVLIGGTLVSRIWGIEGTMRLLEGQQSDKIIRRDIEVISVRLPDGTAADVEASDLHRWVGKPARRIGNSAWTVAVAGFERASEARLRFEQDPTGLAPPALQVSVVGDNFPVRSAWLEPVARDTARRQLQLGMMAVESTWLHDAEAEADWRNAADPARQYRLRYSVPDGDTIGVLTVTLPDGRETRIEAPAAGGEPTPLPDGATVHVGLVLANGVIGQDEQGRPRFDERPVGEPGFGPAIQLAIRWEGGSQAHTAFSAHPEFPTRGGGHASLQDGLRLVRIGATPDGRLFGAVHDPDGRADATVRELKIGEAVPTPWVGIRVTVDELLTAARGRREIVPVDYASVQARGEHPVAAVRLRVSGPGGESDLWSQFGRPTRVTHGGGPLEVEWYFLQQPLGFTVRLLDFRKVNDPGTTQAASFESDVFVEDVLRGRREKVLIKMNEPLLHGGPAWLPGLDWAFYQESYDILSDGRELSQLQVAYDPGYPIVMIGSLLIVGGIFTMFYLVPYFQPTRRRAATAQGAPE